MACEGYYTPRLDYEQNPSLPLDADSKRYAIVKLRSPFQPSATWPRGDYALIYTTPQASATFGSTRFVAGGKIVSRSGGCATSPEQTMTNLEIESVRRAPLESVAETVPRATKRGAQIIWAPLDRGTQRVAVSDRQRILRDLQQTGV